MADRTVIIDRPLAYDDAGQTPIDATLPLHYVVYVGTDKADAMLHPLPIPGPSTDARIHLTFQESNIPIGSYVCVTAMIESAPSFWSESGCRGGIYLPAIRPPQIFVLGD